MDLQLRGRRALVTGGSKGIGLAVGEVLVAEGCNIILAARDGERLAKAAQTLRSNGGGSVDTVVADLGKADDQARLASEFGDIDILVNNAGSNPPREIDDITEEVWRRAWDLKVFGYINMTRAFYSKMKQRRSGVIVNVIGNSGERMQSRYILGSSGNSALMSMTKALGARSPDHNVRIVGVNPGLTATDRAMFMLESWIFRSDAWERQRRLPTSWLSSRRPAPPMLAARSSRWTAGHATVTLEVINERYRQDRDGAAKQPGSYLQRRRASGRASGARFRERISRCADARNLAQHRPSSCCRRKRQIQADHFDDFPGRLPTIRRNE
jgi:NAD(P)-dependent dehydrogenase (short-subunit alcohol dehydrogenase family)